MDNSKTGVVIGVERSSAIVLTPSGEFKRAAIRGRPPRIGEEIPIDPVGGRMFGWFRELAWSGARWNLVAACLSFLLILAVGGYVGRDLLFRPEVKLTEDQGSTGIAAGVARTGDTKGSSLVAAPEANSGGNASATGSAGAYSGTSPGNGKSEGTLPAKGLSLGPSIRTPEPKLRIYIKGAGEGSPGNGSYVAFGREADGTMHPVAATTGSPDPAMSATSGGVTGTASVGTTAGATQNGSNNPQTTTGNMLAMTRSVAEGPAASEGVPPRITPQAETGESPLVASVRVLSLGKSASFVGSNSGPSSIAHSDGDSTGATGSIGEAEAKEDKDKDKNKDGAKANDKGETAAQGEVSSGQ